MKDKSRVFSPVIYVNPHFQFLTTREFKKAVSETQWKILWSLNKDFNVQQ